MCTAHSVWIGPRLLLVVHRVSDRDRLFLHAGTVTSNIIRIVAYLYPYQYKSLISISIVKIIITMCCTRTGINRPVSTNTQVIRFLATLEGWQN